jgi:uncharacterized protein YaaN involved in tellurite resistance
MATETKLKLEAPEVVQTVQPADAAGLVPLKQEERSALDVKVDAFVDDLVATDANSPEFGKKVDQLTNMGRKEIAEAAGHSNRFLDRPVKAIDSDTGIGADLTALRKTVEELDPGKQGNLSTSRKILGSSPSATSSTIISRNISLPRLTSRRSSAASPRARTSC